MSEDHQERASRGENAELASGDASESCSGHVRHGDLELAKWIAVVTMTIDHFGKIVDPSVYLVTNDIGRTTFPLFAWIIGTRLAMQPVLIRSYLENLALWALVSQPVFVFVGKNWTDPNILVTLALGVAAHRALRTWSNGRRTQAGLVLGAIAVSSVFVDYGFFGVFSVPLIAALCNSGQSVGAWAAGPLGVLANLSVHAPYFGPGGLWSLAASPISLASLGLRLKLPRLPKHVFYAYYPLHLLALHALAIALR